jgi:hypothetical protein
LSALLQLTPRLTSDAGRFRDGATIAVTSCGSVYCSVLQCVTQIHQSTAQAAFVGYAYLFSAPGVRVQHA